MDSQKQESPHRAGFLGRFVDCLRQPETAIWCTRRRLNWVLRCPYSLGVVGGASVRHTCGHTRRFLLATFSWHPRGAKQHQIVTSSFDLLPPVRRGQG